MTTTPEMAALVEDLTAEEQALDDLVAGLPDEDWERPTPSPGWAVRDQIGHLSFSEHLAAMAAADPEAFGARLSEALADLPAFERRTKEEFHAGSPAELLERWREQRRATVDAVLAHDPKDRIPWVASAMSPRSFLTARLMETWAHGQHVRDGLGLPPSESPRLRQVADLGVRTRRFSFTNRGMEPPEGEVRVELTAPDGEVWAWGPEDAPDRITGPAVDFCLVVTQARHVDDTRLETEGEGATEWMRHAQVFAGPPTQGPPPGGRTS
ncbi:MAG: TIGR03084 family metal-binding protein [Acidimicrobiia bacterium]|nr:TIGR03084 family metal-binding protein [Acidimicrobiia bacterium]